MLSIKDVLPSVVEGGLSELYPALRPRLTPWGLSVTIRLPGLYGRKDPKVSLTDFMAQLAHPLAIIDPKEVQYTPMMEFAYSPSQNQLSYRKQNVRLVRKDFEGVREFWEISWLSAFFFKNPVSDGMPWRLVQRIEVEWLWGDEPTRDPDEMIEWAKAQLRRFVPRLLEYPHKDPEIYVYHAFTTQEAYHYIATIKGAEPPIEPEDEE